MLVEASTYNLEMAAPGPCSSLATEDRGSLSSDDQPLAEYISSYRAVGTMTRSFQCALAAVIAAVRPAAYSNFGNLHTIGMNSL